MHRTAGDYPYPSNYLTGGGPLLPGYPMREACKALATPNLQGDDLLAALRDGAAVYNNATQDLTCYTPPADVEEDGEWDYQWCTELLPQESYFTLDGKKDMFWSQPYDPAFIRARCQSKYNVTPIDDWIRISYGNMPDALQSTSNIVLSNGLLGEFRGDGGGRCCWTFR